MSFWKSPAPKSKASLANFWDLPKAQEPAPEAPQWKTPDAPPPPVAPQWKSPDAPDDIVGVDFKAPDIPLTALEKLHQGTLQFDNFDHFDWDSVGTVSIVGNFGAFTPTVGDAMAQLYATGDASAAQMEAFLGLASGALASLGLGNPTTGSAMLITLYTTAETVDMSFDWLFNATDYLPYNDFGFFVGPDGNAVKLASVGDVGNHGDSGWQTYQQEILPLNGQFTLGFGVIDVGDMSGSPYLFIDNIQTEPSFWMQPSHDASGIGLDFWMVG